MADTGVRCGTCKWLEVPPDHRTKSGAVSRRNDFHMYPCRAQFPKPLVPDRIEISWRDRGFMSPSYGRECPFWAPIERSL